MISVTNRALVCGGGGFIGNHLVKRLKQDGLWVRAVDLKPPAYSESAADEFIIGDLRNPAVCRDVMDMDFDEVYQLAADMGGAEYIFTGDNDADIMRNSATINLNVMAACCSRRIGSLFFSSSACIYPFRNQSDPEHPNCEEASAYPADPDSEYGWEKLFSERLYLAHGRNKGINVRIGRYHNVFGPEGAWVGGREKAPAAICRKVALARSGDKIDVLGDGLQTRSFLFINDCIEATVRLSRSDFEGPVNIGSEEMVTIDELVDLISSIAGKKREKAHQRGPVGVRGRNSDNRLIRSKLGWTPATTLRAGLAHTYAWIESEVSKAACHQAVAANQ
jgi:nucleoside-diphosphate-sugar epimerase